MGELTRRQVLLGATAGLGLVAVGGLSAVGAAPIARRLHLGQEDSGPDGVIPAAPAGRVRYEHVRSRARGQQVGFWTAVPAGHGDGAGLPVCLILHGASATTEDYDDFGFARFLTAAVRAGVPPFVLAGADGGVTLWEGDGDRDDPQRMLRDEVPAWCAARGFDAERLATYGWSMGGYGSLRLFEENPTMLRATALLSPAVRRGDAVFRDVARLDGARLGVWCGQQDMFYDDVRALVARVRPTPQHAWAPGRHQRGYWNSVTPAAFALVGAALAGNGS